MACPARSCGLAAPMRMTIRIGILLIAGFLTSTGLAADEPPEQQGAAVVPGFHAMVHLVADPDTSIRGHSLPWLSAGGDLHIHSVGRVRLGVRPDFVSMTVEGDMGTGGVVPRLYLDGAAMFVSRMKWTAGAGAGVDYMRYRWMVGGPTSPPARDELSTYAFLTGQLQQPHWAVFAELLLGRRVILSDEARFRIRRTEGMLFGLGIGVAYRFW